jgi:hypothetical protein
MNVRKEKEKTITLRAQLDKTKRWKNRKKGCALYNCQTYVGGTVHRGVALQVAFERETLKPVFHFIGYRLWV